MSHAEALHTLAPAAGATDALVDFAHALRFDVLFVSPHESGGILALGGSWGNLVEQGQRALTSGEETDGGNQA